MSKCNEAEEKGEALKGVPMQIFVHYTLPGCSGCRICEQVCSLKHEGVVNPAKSRIRILPFPPGPIDVPIVCFNCDDHPCVNACQAGKLGFGEGSGAMTYDEKTHTIKVDPEICNGWRRCHNCYDACVKHGRGGRIFFHPPPHDYAMVCDLCGGDPECVKYCPGGCLGCKPGGEAGSGGGILEFLPRHPLAKFMAKPAEVIAKQIKEQLYPADANTDE